jgi:LacI family transcriptional regulator
VQQEGDAARETPTGDAARRSRPVTLADLAREAGTSPATASRAMSGRGYVSADVRERLQTAAKRLRYVPDASARALKGGTSRVIGVVVSDLGNQFYGRLAAGIEQALREADFRMMLVGDNSESGEELAAVTSFLAMRARGVILTPVSGEASALLARHGVAVVEVDRQTDGSRCDGVLVDNERGAFDATSHLLALGHRRIAVLVTETTWITDTGRLQGYRAAHRAIGVPVDEQLILRIGFHAPDTRHRIGALLDATAPTAIFATNNLLAEDAWRCLRDRRLRLPEDASLVAFDDLPWMEMVEPGITAVAQPTWELGRRAAQLLLRRIDDPASAPVVERLRPGLVVRGSAGRPPV